MAAGTTALALALGAVAGAAPGSDARSELDVAFTTGATGAPGGVRFHVLYKHPDDPEAKPPPLESAEFALPAGTRIDTGAVPACKASDADFRARGRDACSPESRVGEGTLSAMTGIGPATEFDTTAFNGEGELIELVLVKGTNTMAAIDRLSVKGSTLTAHPPATPGGPPDGRTAVREINLTIPTRGRYLVTPDTCAGAWQTRGRFGFADGGTSAVTSTSPCVSNGVAPGTAMRVVVKPGTLRAGRRVRVAIGIRSVSPACRRGVVVRVGRRRAVTDASGHARLVVRLRSPARLRAAKPGCRTAFRTLRVRR